MESASGARTKDRSAADDHTAAEIWNADEDRSPQIETGGSCDLTADSSFRIIRPERSLYLLAVHGISFGRRRDEQPFGARLYHRCVHGFRIARVLVREKSAWKNSMVLVCCLFPDRRSWIQPAVLLLAQQTRLTNLDAADVVVSSYPKSPGHRDKLLGVVDPDTRAAGDLRLLKIA